MFAPATEPETLTAAQTSLENIAHLAPMMIVAFWSLLHLLADAFAGPGMRRFQRRLAFVGLGLAAAAAATQFGTIDYDDGTLVFSGFLVVDQFSLLLDLALLGIAAAVIGFAGDHARAHRFEYGEQESLILIALFGMMTLVHAADMIALFLGIETMSIAVYVLVGARWNHRQSAEAAMKYFLVGAFSSGLLVMGIALLYGATGATSLVEVGTGMKNAFRQWLEVQPLVADLEAHTVSASVRAQVEARAVLGIAPAALALPGMLLTLVGLLFKISAVPFHMWTPDAYEGAPSPTTAFMAAGVKIGGLAALLKLFVAIFFLKRLVSSGYAWTNAVSLIALLTMVVGNLAAVRQTNIKRLLAYSSVAHVGYILVGVVAAASFYGSGVSTGSLRIADQLEWAHTMGDEAVAGIIFYVLTYSVATVGAFACVSLLGGRGREANQSHEWSGLAQRHPGVAFSMTICLLSLMGLPPLAGFFGKLFVFKAALTHTSMWLRFLVVFALLNAVVGAYYYLRLIVSMYFRPSPADPVGLIGGRGAAIVAAICAAVSIALGVGADGLMRRAELAASGFVYPPGVGAKAQWVDRLRARWEAADEAAAMARDADDEAPVEAPGEGADAPAQPPEADAAPADAAPADAAPADAAPSDAAAVPAVAPGGAPVPAVRLRPAAADGKAPPARRPVPDAKAG
jgi:NADH-quinone oxidoreductase subunit N